MLYSFIFEINNLALSFLVSNYFFEIYLLSRAAELMLAAKLGVEEELFPF